MTCPIHDHSFLLADWCFGRVEIKSADEYVKFYKEVGKVKEPEKEWMVYDIKVL